VDDHRIRFPNSTDWKTGGRTPSQHLLPDSPVISCFTSEQRLSLFSPALFPLFRMTSTSGSPITLLTSGSAGLDMAVRAESSIAQERFRFHGFNKRFGVANVYPASARLDQVRFVARGFTPVSEPIAFLCSSQAGNPFGADPDALQKTCNRRSAKNQHVRSRTVLPVKNIYSQGLTWIKRGTDGQYRTPKDLGGERQQRILAIGGESSGRDWKISSRGKSGYQV
jgi:hypothetical protein